MPLNIGKYTKLELDNGHINIGYSDYSGRSVAGRLWLLEALMPSEKLSPKKKRQWNHVYDSAKKKGDSEASAHKKANAVAYRKKDFGETEIEELKEKGWIDEAYIIEGRRLNQDEANYRALAGSEDKGCWNCHWYVPQDDACIVVAGDIYHTGISDYWMAIEIYEPEPMEVRIVKSWGDRVKDILGFNKDKFELGEKQFVTFKDNEGNLRFIARPTNFFRDRQKEIICEDAHKEYVEWCDATKSYPELWVWHCPGSRLGKADFVDYVDGFIVASGIIDKGYEEAAQELSNEQDIAMSHGFKYLQDGDTITKYRTFEWTLLPIAHASNIWTDISTIMEENVSFSTAKREWLETRFGKERTDEFEKNTKDLSEKLKGMGIDWKDDDTEPEPEPVPVPAESITLETLSQQLTTLASVTQGMRGDVDALMVGTATQAEAIKALKEDDDTKVAAAFRSPATSVTRPTESPNNVVDPSKIKEVDTEWFSKVIQSGVEVATGGVK